MLSRVRKTPGRKKISKEIRELIFKMVAENPNWGAPRVHGELLMVGFDVSERTVSRWMRRAPRDSEAAQRILARHNFYRPLHRGPRISFHAPHGLPSSPPG